MTRTRTFIQTAPEILAAAYISDDLNLGESPSPQLITQICHSRAEGLRVVRVYWATGEVIWLPCPPGTDMPDPAMVVAGYQQCQGIKKIHRPEGALQCN